MGWQGPMTHRQFLGWRAWLSLEWNRPSRTDQYIMAVCAEVRRVLHRNPERVQLKNFVLKFEDHRPTNAPKISEADAQKMAMQRWMGAVGGRSAVTIIEVDAEDYDPHQEFDPTPYIVEAGGEES